MLFMDTKVFRFQEIAANESFEKTSKYQSVALLPFKNGKRARKTHRPTTKYMYLYLTLCEVQPRSDLPH